MQGTNMMKNLDLNNDSYYVNRELSWLDFNYRILSEAKDRRNPLFERMLFLSITASNLDEFFMIRVASLKDMVNALYTKKDMSGLTPEKQLSKISEKTHQLVKDQYGVYNKFISSLDKKGIVLIKKYEELSEKQNQFVDEYFENEVYPVLTPMAVDSSRPFPLIRNKTLNICALLYDKNSDNGYDFATVQVPSMLDRVINIPSEVEGKETYILLEQIIEKNIDKLFLNYEVICAYPYRIMRNADLTIDEDEASDLLKEIQNKLKMRQWGEVIRLEVEENIDKKLLRFLENELNVAEEDVFRIPGPIDLTVLMKLYGIEGFDNLKYEQPVPQPVPEIVPGENIFDVIKEKDIFLHHPYQTFDPVVDFIRQAAKDPNVLAIDRKSVV